MKLFLSASFRQKIRFSFWSIPIRLLQFGFFGFVKFFGRLNNYGWAPETDTLISFRKALDASSGELTWIHAKHKYDSGLFQAAAQNSFKDWFRLNLKVHHSIFVPRISDIGRSALIFSKIERFNQRLSRSMFKSYRFPELIRQSWYSVPDVLFPMKALDELPGTVLDVGAGTGRVAIAHRALGVKRIIQMDVTEAPYLMQNHVVRQFDDGVQFLDQPREFSLRLENLNFFVSMPVWEFNAIPTESIDLCCAVQVLREVDDYNLVFLVKNIHRVLKPSGIFYIRSNDVEFGENKRFTVSFHELMRKIGFAVAHRPEFVHGIEIHGEVVIYRKLSCSLPTKALD